MPRQRECVQCGRVFRGTHRRCESCQAIERECAGCGRTFRGKTTRCRPCQATDRDCAGCGRSFRGCQSRCWACSSIERACVQCGRTFCGTNTWCRPCRATGRDCAGCGQQFRGYGTRCRQCSAVDRECESCGRALRGSHRICGSCQAAEHSCAGCGRVFYGTNTRCTACQWAETPPAWRSARNRRQFHAYRARKLAAQDVGPVPAEVYTAIMAAGPCSYCGKSATTVDHILPFKRGGREHEDNLTPACKPCNSSKGSKLLTEWRPDRVARGVVACPKVAAEYQRQISQSREEVSACL